MLSNELTALLVRANDANERMLGEVNDAMQAAHTADIEFAEAELASLRSLGQQIESALGDFIQTFGNLLTQTSEAFAAHLAGRERILRQMRGEANE